MAAGVDLVPGLAAGVAVAGFEHHHEGIETGDDFADGAVGDFEVFVVGGVGGEVEGLARVVL